MKRYGTKKISTHVKGHQDCGVCHPAQKSHKHRARQSDKDSFMEEQDLKIYVSFDTDYETEGGCEDDHVHSWCDRGYDVITSFRCDVSLREYGDFPFSQFKKLKSIWLLIDKYSDGDTFGGSEYLELVAIHKSYKDAVDDARAREWTGRGYFGRHLDYEIVEVRKEDIKRL